MKRTYLKPLIEVFVYGAEEGFATSVALHKDYVLVAGDGEDRSTLRASEEVTEYTDESGEYERGTWL